MTVQAEHMAKYIKANKKARILAVTSGKGGVGKTNIICNLGILLAKAGAKVTLIDADIGLANVDSVLSIYPEYTLNHVLSGEKSLKEIVVKGPAGVSVVPGGADVVDLALLEEDRLKNIVEQFSDFEKTSDFILIDTGAGISLSVLVFVLAVPELLVVTTPEPTAIRDAYTILKIAVSNSYSVDAKLLVNMATSEEEGQMTGEKIRTVMKRFLDYDLECVQSLPYDHVVPKAVKEGIPFSVGAPDSLVSNCLKNTSDMYFGRAQRRQRDISDIFGDLVRFVKRAVS